MGEIRRLALGGAARREPERLLAALADRVLPGEQPEDAAPRLEQRVATLLGKPAALMFATGTMAQQVALRIHAEARGTRTVAFHPQCHLEVWEHKGYEHVHGLHSVLLGNRHELITLSDVDGLVEPIAALLLELPQRDLGGLLPSWDDLVAQTEAARSRGAAVHMDGARLWEAQPFYGRSHAEIAALFDSVYVSVYKGLMAPSGAVLAGEEDFIAHARLWRDRLGGNVDRVWPLAMAAERGLDELLPRMGEFCLRAKAIAAALGRIDGVRIAPSAPQTPMFHLHLSAPAARVREAIKQLADEVGLALPSHVQIGDHPELCKVELCVNEHFDEVTDQEISDLVEEVLNRAR